MSASGVQAAPLCKDLKGLFTPCPKELNRAASKRLEAKAVREHRTVSPSQASPAEAESAVIASDARPGRAVSEPKPRHVTPPPFVAGVTVADPGTRHRAKLCKDLKGLFTPCPK